ncbi:MAG: Hsp20/alpha crystallin family protein [Rhodocyclaceae bacterium]|nr:Hsp20/alpha crystallin family protein [Rhodocyclaceae bacterium]
MNEHSRQVTNADVQNAEPALVPPVDVIETPDGITLWLDMPGVPKDKLVVRVDNDALTIEGSATFPTPDGLEQVYAEQRLPRYRRSFTLSRELDAAGVQASFKDGVLCVKVPRAEAARPRRVEVRLG